MGKRSRFLRRKAKSEFDASKGSKDEPPQSANGKRSLLYFIFVTTGLFSVLFGVAFLTGAANDIQFEIGIKQSILQLFDPTTSAFVFVGGIFLDLVALGLIGLSIALLFEIDFAHKFVSSYGGTRWWRFLKRFAIREKRLWHITLGYFIVISIAISALADTLLEKEKKINPNFSQYESQIIIIILTAPVTLIARILSKLDVQIIDTNIGFFVIVLYLGAVFFEIWIGNVPFYHYAGLLSSELNSPQGSFMSFLSTIIVSIIFSLLDAAFIRYKMRKTL